MIRIATHFGPAGLQVIMTNMYRVLIEAHNVLMQLEEGVRRSGFVQTYWIEAGSADAAASQALKRAAEDRELREQIANAPDSPPRFSIYEVERCTPEEIAEIEANPTSRASFPETFWSRLNYWFRKIRGRASCPALFTRANDHVAAETHPFELREHNHDPNRGKAPLVGHATGGSLQTEPLGRASDGAVMMKVRQNEELPSSASFGIGLAGTGIRSDLFIAVGTDGTVEAVGTRSGYPAMQISVSVDGGTEELIYVAPAMWDGLGIWYDEQVHFKLNPGRSVHRRAACMPLMMRRASPLAPVMLFGALVLASCENRTPVEYRLPDGYRGWVLIEYGTAACPPLEQREGHIIVPVDAGGRACTSSSFESGEAADSFVYVRAGAKEPFPADGQIFHHVFVRCTDPGRPERRYEQFFVGKRGEPRPPLKDPCVTAR